MLQLCSLLLFLLALAGTAAAEPHRGTPSAAEEAAAMTLVEE